MRGDEAAGAQAAGNRGARPRPYGQRLTIDSADPDAIDRLRAGRFQRERPEGSRPTANQCFTATPFLTARVLAHADVKRTEIL
ncbi:hypothetical protein CKO51_27540 [Rhodopirellula sp. SM50]|nr:hypothetical protein CKO51_27540 [Rhodopirellula sp. SM50]